MKRLLIALSFTCSIPAVTFSQDNNYALDFDLFAISLGLNDTASARTYFESDSSFNVNQWEIFEPNFSSAIGKYSYADLTDSYIAGEPVKQLLLEYTWSDTDMEGNPMSGTTSIYVFFKETADGLKMIEYFRPEGTDAP